MVRESQRTKGIKATFYWRLCVSGRHIDEAVHLLMKCALSDPRRSLTSYRESDLREEFRARLRRAERGRLTPSEDCKPLRVDPEVYEIRWSDVPLTRKDPVSGLYADDDVAQFRLYYGEPEAKTFVGKPWFVGLHGHEKTIIPGDDDETTRLQDAEIQKAVRAYRHDDGCWGIAELEA